MSKNPVDPADDREEEDRVEFRPPTTGSNNLLEAVRSTSTSSSSLESSKTDKAQFKGPIWEAEPE